MPDVYRNGKLETVSVAEWQRTVAANRAKQAARVAEQAARAQRVKKVVNEGGKVRVTTEDGKTHEVKNIGRITGGIVTLITGSTGPINTGTGDIYVDGEKQKKPKRNPWF